MNGGKPFSGGTQGVRPRGQAQYKVDVIGSGCVDQLLQFGQPAVIVRTAASRVDQHQIAVGERIECLLHLGGVRHDPHGQVDNLRIGSQLFDGGNAIGVDGDQSQTTLFVDAKMARQLGQGRRFADPRRADNHGDLAFPGRRNVTDRTAIKSLRLLHDQRATARNTLLHQCRQQRHRRGGVCQLIRSGVPMQALNQFPGDFILDIRFHQCQVVWKQFRRDLDQTARLRSSSQIRDHLLQRIQPLSDRLSSVSIRIKIVRG